MSLATWKKEFYPKSANSRMSKRDAILHSIRKWEGLRKENLRKHGLKFEIVSKSIVDKNGSEMEIDVSSCALCVKYYYSNKNLDRCVECPLQKTLGRPCDQDDASVYNRFLRSVRRTPEPMIKALNLTLKNLDEGKI